LGSAHPFFSFRSSPDLKSSFVDLCVTCAFGSLIYLPLFRFSASFFLWLESRDNNISKICWSSRTDDILALAFFIGLCIFFSLPPQISLATGNATYQEAFDLASLRLVPAFRW